MKCKIRETWQAQFERSGGETTGMFSNLVFDFPFHAEYFECIDLLGTCGMNLSRPWGEFMQITSLAQ